MIDSRDAQIEARVGTTLAGKYLLTRLLGRGGMGAVFEAVNTWTERRVAIEVMLGDAGRDPDMASRFLCEARAATRIEHPNIVQVLDMGREDSGGALNVVQEFLQGTDLRDRSAQKPSPW